MRFTHSNPVELLFGQGVLTDQAGRIRTLGSRALIVTGRTSARASGILNELTESLNNHAVQWEIFDEVEENPGFDVVARGALYAGRFNADIIIGAGGGSPMDAAKAIAVLAGNPGLAVEELLFPQKRTHLPVVCIPSTAGTGSEVTPYAILTLEGLQTKSSLKCSIWPALSYVDTRYLHSMPPGVRCATCLDGLLHLMESALSSRASFLSDAYAEKGLELVAPLLPVLRQNRLDEQQWESLAASSVLGGMSIAQTGTTLPHGAGYLLTVRHGLAHGRATALTAPVWLQIHPDQQKVGRLLAILGMAAVEDFRETVRELAGPVRLELPSELLKSYAAELMNNGQKLANHPGPVTAGDLEAMYREATREDP